MNIAAYKIDLEKAIKKINQKKYKNIILQLPDGLKNYFNDIADFLEEKTDATLYIYSEPCFGACDIPVSKIKDINADLIIQIGHLPINSIKNPKVPVLFLNANSNLDIRKVIIKVIPRLNGKNIGILTTSQHIDSLEKASKILKENGFDVFIGKGDNRIYSEGQILGCNFSSARVIKDKVDSYLYIGSGNFHPLGLILSTNKTVIACDPYTNEIKEKELIDLKDVILRQRYGAIARARDSEVFGIIISTKIGQKRLKLAEEIKEKIISKKKKAYFFFTDDLNSSNLENFRNVDCFVSTACPRIAIDDYMRYKTPILTAVEIDILLGFKKWDEYCFDEIKD